MSSNFLGNIFNNLGNAVNNAVTTVVNAISNNSQKNDVNNVSVFDNNQSSKTYQSTEPDKSNTQSVFDSYHADNNKNTDQATQNKNNNDNGFIMNLLHQFTDSVDTPLSSLDILKETENEFSLLKRKSGNGKIDSDFAQGQMNDCVFLASVYSLMQSDKTAKIINDSIELKKDEDGNIEGYNITFGGLGETYYISQADVDKAATQFKISNDNNDASKEDVVIETKDRSYSYGDDDMTALELAFEKACINSNNEDFKSRVETVQNIYTQSSRKSVSEIDRLYAVNENSLLYALGLPDSTITNVYNFYDDLTDEDTIFAQSPDGKIYYYANNSDNQTIKDINGNDVKLEGKYLVKELNGNEVVLEKNVFLFLKKTEKVSVDELSALQQFYNTDLSTVDRMLDDYQKNRSGLFIIDCFSDNSNPKNDDYSIHVSDVNGKDTELIRSHAYALKDVDDDTVTLVNPHDTSEEIKLTRRELYDIQRFQVRYSDCKTD